MANSAERPPDVRLPKNNPLLTQALINPDLKLQKRHGARKLLEALGIPPTYGAAAELLQTFLSSADDSLIEKVSRDFVGLGRASPRQPRSTRQKTQHLE